ncbi:uncharacterized protein LOC117644376 isoform X2 [Thrips palmi]|uniref:Uncharacterized protein LOC117644376 isoform X2 n=1 Tax=Thrips palmi TaxID=161013 RepID=A0A6P8YIP1_THRPL|nr:uncharacterized protein LOC117644376 isoform X2 [Thrips palmi]
MSVIFSRRRRLLSHAPDDVTVPWTIYSRSSKGGHHAWAGGAELCLRTPICFGADNGSLWPRAYLKTCAERSLYEKFTRRPESWVSESLRGRAWTELKIVSRCSSGAARCARPRDNTGWLCGFADSVKAPKGPKATPLSFASSLARIHFHFCGLYFYLADMAHAKGANLETDSTDLNRRGSRDDVCRAGQWSFTARPLLRVSHTWVLERNALLGCEWRLLSSRKFGSPRDEDVVWTLSLEVDYPDCARLDSLRTPDMVRVCVAFSTEVPHKRVHFRAALHAQQEAHGALGVLPSLPSTASSASSASLDDKYAMATQVSAPGAPPSPLADMILAHPVQRQHIGDVYVVASDRSLTIRVDIDYLADVEEPQAGPASVSLRVPPCSLVADMEALLVGGGAVSDVVLVAEADGREWRAHKAILAARSPVFAAMFKHDMAEKQSSRVAVGDVSGEVFDQVLRVLAASTGLAGTCTLGARSTSARWAWTCWPWRTATRCRVSRLCARRSWRAACTPTTPWRCW